MKVCVEFCFCVEENYYDEILCALKILLFDFDFAKNMN